ncbi:MAG: nuclear transport factor 2 family protein [Proteobacteria bacterium]|nr:nuclear transport factor 2 family protein [Pseudomonadota bacterium]HQR03366.1 nuclear transport factor 2 family protein [Rhodocyclaceae bacterium]
MFAHEEVARAVERLINAQSSANDSGDWTWFVDELYTEDAVYICEYAGTTTVEARGRAEIKATHYGRDMRGWEGWSFPYEGYMVNGSQAVTHWYNRGPGLRPDGSHYQTHGISFLTYAGNGMFSHQYDLFDLAHQMRLCDELEDAGLLSPVLKEIWVTPSKRRLLDMLNRKEGYAPPASS